MAVEGWALHTGFWMWAYIMPIAAIVGASNIHLAAKKRADAKLRLAREEIEHLAKVVERERIARDLHDVLGHTFSVVVLKSELVAKLVDSDAGRARQEMNEVEQIAREALGEVRHAIRGYRARDLGEELVQARATLWRSLMCARSAKLRICMRCLDGCRPRRRPCWRWWCGNR
jgi:two-component system, NarL family, sensor histidine kinase DesK